ncbi:MAG: hypothetical protein ABR552_09065 [Actinomycetota bacterium]
MSARALTLASFASAAVCTAAGIWYLADGTLAAQGAGRRPGIVLLTFAVIGAATLVVSGLWQELAPAGERGLPLAILGALSAGFLLANVGGLLADVPGSPLVLHALGLALALVLFGGTLGEIVVSVRRARA